MTSARRAARSRVLVILSGEQICIQAPFRQEFVDELHQTAGAQWSNGSKREKGWWVSGESARRAARMLASFFYGHPLVIRARGVDVDHGLLEHLGPAPRDYERPPSGCQHVSCWFTYDEIRRLIDERRVVVHRPIGLSVEPEAMDVESEEFWLSGFGYEITSIYGELGEWRWADEVFGVVDDGALIAYAADHEFAARPPGVRRWCRRTSMRREQSRLVVALADVSAHRIQDLPSEDYANDKPGFALRWDKKDFDERFGWTRDPWVWRLSFDCVLPQAGSC